MSPKKKKVDVEVPEVLGLDFPAYQNRELVHARLEEDGIHYAVVSEDGTAQLMNGTDFHKKYVAVSPAKDLSLKERV